MLERLEENIKVFVQVNQPSLCRRCMSRERKQPKYSQVGVSFHWLFWKRQWDRERLFFVCVFACVRARVCVLKIYGCNWNHQQLLLFWQRPEKAWYGDTPCDLCCHLYGNNFPTKTLIRNANYHLYVGNSGVCFGSDMVRPEEMKLLINMYAYFLPRSTSI